MEMVMCPRCRAEGIFIEFSMQDGYGVCPRCDTTWKYGKHDEMISIPTEK